jgi:DNA polymerase-3 subunit gamma/tau
MSYLVMARKWRPRNFDEMVGQEHVARTLRNAIESDRVSHAFLFTGTRGVGKTTSARILAKALNCLKGPTATPCEQCENCVAVNRGASMDVLEIDGASNNSVDDIRELREQVAYAPMQGKYKIYIIDEVHMLSKSAFNALLKTLEEPPPHVVFIFATTESGKVPHTILSRVQRFDFKRISEAAIRERLEYICGQEGVKPERAALEAIARKADGSMRDALSLFDRVFAFAGSELTLEAARKALGIPAERMFDDLFRHLAGRDAGGCLAVLNDVYEEGLEVAEFLVGFGEYLRDLLFARQRGVTPELLGLGADRFAQVKELAGDLQDGDILRYAKIVSDLVAGLRAAPHPRLWVEMGMARMAALDRVVTLAQLMGQEPAPVAIPAAGDPNAAPPAADKKKNPELTTPERRDDSLAEPLDPEEAPGIPEPTAESPPPSPVPDFSDAPEPAAESGLPEYEEGSDLGDDLGGIPAPGGSSGSLSSPEGSATGRIWLPAEMPGAWADLVEDYALDRPFTSSPLRHSRLDWKDGETGTLEVTFAGAHYHDLFLSDGENRKSLREFLASRLAPGTQFTLAFSGGEAGEGEAPATIRTIHPAASAQALLEEEPGLRKLIEVFEGRLID